MEALLQPHHSVLALYWHRLHQYHLEDELAIAVLRVCPQTSRTNSVGGIRERRFL